MVGILKAELREEWMVEINFLSGTYIKVNQEIKQPRRLMKQNHKKNKHKTLWFGLHKDKQFGVCFFSNRLFAIIDKEYIKELMQMYFCLLFSYFPIIAESTYFTGCEN